MKGGYQDLWKAIIRPPRDEYNISELGPTDFYVQNIQIFREDLVLKNKRNLKLECSFYQQVNRPCKRLPCVVYLHGNSSSRVEATQGLKLLLSQNIQLFSFDFSGCGKSEGEYISLGWYERDDIDEVVNYLRQSDLVSTIGLWGRSMGAITAMMHADRDPSIAGLVLDSGFSSLRELAEDLCKEYTSLPSFILSVAMSFIRNTIKTKANFDIDNLKPIDHVKSAFIPAFFIAAQDDTFIRPKHTQKLYNDYAGDKNIHICKEGNHNSARPQFLLDSIAIFFYNTLQCQQLTEATSPQVLKKWKGVNMKKEGEEICQNYKIGNEKEVQNALMMLGLNHKNQHEGDNDDLDDHDEQIERAIKESLKQVNKKQGDKDHDDDNNHIHDNHDIL